MSSRARGYNGSATGARSNPATQSGQAPALEITMPNASTRLVKFDGVHNQWDHKSMGSESLIFD